MSYCILSIETATEFCSLALSVGEKTFTRSIGVPQQHSLSILILIDELMKEAHLPLSQLDAIAVGQGPGSFTGVRLGISVAQGLCAGLSIPCIPISTLAILAYGAKAEAIQRRVNFILPCMDARMQEVYGALYQIKAGQLYCVVEHFVQKSDKVFLHIGVALTPQTCIIAIGTGWQAPYLNDLISAFNPALILDNATPQAEHLAELAKIALQEGRVYQPEDCLPVYCRDKVVF